MAVASKTTAAKTKQSDALPKANGWLNLSIVDTTGKHHNLPKGVALFDETTIHRSMLNKLRAMQKAAEEAGEDIPQTLQFQFSGTVSLARADDAADIPL